MKLNTGTDFMFGLDYCLLKVGKTLEKKMLFQGKLYTTYTKLWLGP
jgi:hypothetical protein